MRLTTRLEIRFSTRIKLIRQGEALILTDFFCANFLAPFAKNFASLRLKNKIFIEASETNPKLQFQHLPKYSTNVYFPIAEFQSHHHLN